jgi:hypothetical protein
LFLAFAFRDKSLKGTPVCHRFLKRAAATKGPDFECVAEQELAGMTHDRRAKTDLNERKESEGRLLTRISGDAPKSLEAKLASLEARVVKLEERVDRLDGIVPSYYYGATDESKKKPGPDKYIEDVELFRHRDGLVGWLEDVWPKIVKPVLAAADPSEVAGIFSKVARPKDLQPPWQSRFLAYPSDLFDFLRSEKFRIKPPKQTVIDALNLPEEDEKRKRAANRLPPRQIANAMAGLPELEWRTSLDKCSKNPCSSPVALNTDRYYRAMFSIPVPEDRTPKR